MKLTKKELGELKRMITHYLTASHEGTYFLREVRDAMLLHDKIEEELVVQGLNEEVEVT